MIESSYATKSQREAGAEEVRPEPSHSRQEATGHSPTGRAEIGAQTSSLAIQAVLMRINETGSKNWIEGCHRIGRSTVVSLPEI